MVFGLFSKERALERAQKRAMNKLAQSADRWAAMEKLLEAGDDECLYTLCKRFSFASQKMVEDEQEKAWVVQALTQKGERALPALRRYMKSASSVAYPLRVLENVAASAKVLEMIDECLADEPPGYTRDPSKRAAYIEWLGEWEGTDAETINKRIIPYLADYDENVRFAAVEAISHRITDNTINPLFEALVRSEEESGRLKLRIAEVLASTEAHVGDYKKSVQTMFEDVLSDFRLQRDRLISKKK